jgi:hypothetical protein
MASKPKGWAISTPAIRLPYPLRMCPRQVPVAVSLRPMRNHCIPISLNHNLYSVIDTDCYITVIEANLSDIKQIESR